MRSHVFVPLVALLGGCGRFGFEGAGEPDASSDARGDATDSAPVSYVTRVIADRPRAYYRLGDGTGGVFRDDVSGADAIAEVDNGTLDLGRPGALSSDANTAVRFSGDGNLGPRIAAWGRLDDAWQLLAGDFTLEVFVRPMVPPPPGWGHGIVICEHYLTNGFRTGWNPELGLAMWSDQGGATGKLESTASMILGSWHHVAFIRRGTTAEIYLDGALVGSGAFDYIAPTADSDCGFGSFHGMPSETELDELAIYDVALSPAQLSAHVAASR